MKQRLFYGILTAEAIACLILYGAADRGMAIFSTLMAFPFEALGYGLRRLSLAGSMGNVIALILYVGICLIPAVWLLRCLIKDRFYPEDLLLGILSILLFGVIYLMINPVFIGQILGVAVGSSETFGKAFLGGMVYSVLIGYGVLKALRLFFGAERKKLQLYLHAVLDLLNMLLIYAAFGSCYESFLASVDRVKEANTGTQQGLGITCFFLFLQFLVNAMPYVLDIFIVLVFQRLLKCLQEEAYTEAAVEAAGKLSKICGAALMAVTVSNVGFNLLQLLIADRLRVINGTVQIPLLSIVLVMAALLAAQFVKDGKELKDDNDMFI